MSRYANSYQIADNVIASSRNRTEWNNRFQHWERPASEFEEAKINRAASMIRDALKNDPLLGPQHVDIEPQGSYHNNTNVRLESDMDIRACWKTESMILTQGNLTLQETYSALGFCSTDQSLADIAAQHRRRIHSALESKFGSNNLDPGSKAFQLEAISGSRAKADIVPAVRLIIATEAGTVLTPSVVPIEGVVIFSRDGKQIFNFPEQHHRHGIKKHNITLRRFKKVVRILKRLRDELVSLGRLKKGQVPSFLIECLVYLVEDWYFCIEEDRYDRIRRILKRIAELLNDPNRIRSATEINEIKLLFSLDQPWTANDAVSFVFQAWKRLED